VLRQQAALDAVIRPLVRASWGRVSEPLRDILRLGAYQLRFLDRVPSHAAVDTTVALAREAGGSRSAGFVNAVLRRMSAAPSTRAEGGDASTHPAWLVERWRGAYGDEAAAALVTWNDTRPRLTVQPAAWPTERLREAFDTAGIQTEEAPHGAGLVLSRGTPAKLPGYREGAFIVQDPAQALVCRYLATPDGAMVYDACAAPGGKSVMLAGKGSRVIAGDRSRDRMTKLRDTVTRTGAPVRLVVADALHPPFRNLSWVLLDAPCTATGTMARHPDARARLSPRTLPTMAARQRALLAAAADLVAPGGHLAYATCSLEREENEDQVNGFLAGHAEFRRDPPPPGTVPEGLLTPDGDLQILPHRDRMDGAYAARLVRVS
jgi:16S rRNA (cytosine967-C5)-methyltransferase